MKEEEEKQFGGLTERTAEGMRGDWRQMHLENVGIDSRAQKSER